MAMWIARTVEEARRLRHASAGSVAFVPTMGALHEGHLSLVRAGLGMADRVIVSIFVNPTQFAPHEDLSRYPRPIERDLELCRDAGASGVFHPDVAVVYPPGVPECIVEVPAVAQDLEGRHRPTHFRGVCRVVAKLFNIIQPSVALFGQKDYQQWKVIQAMVDDLMMPLRIEGLPTVREADGLAMSSRNIYLGPEDRQRALALSRALTRARSMVEEQHCDDASVVEAAMRDVLLGVGADIDYAAVRHPRTLAPLERIDTASPEGVVALIACRIGPVRLIDNMVIGAHA